MGAGLRRGQRVCTEYRERLGALGMQQQQSRKDPRVAVPEGMPGVPRRQPAGAHRPARIGGRRGEQIIKIGMHHRLRQRIAVDDNIGAP